MESKIGSLETAQTKTKDQLLRMEEKFGLDATEMQRSIDELKELIKTGFGARTKEIGEGSSTTPHMKEKALSTVSSVSLTPTHFGTVNETLLRIESGKTQPLPWEGSGTAPKPVSQDAYFKPTEPSIPMELYQLGHPVYPFRQLPINIPYNSQTESTLNPYALPIYPHINQNSVSNPQPIYTNTTISPAATFTLPHHSTISQQPLYSVFPQNTIHSWPHSESHPVRFTHPYSTYKSPKLDFPKFEGQDPRSW